nr:hypothetical transcript [Hymenolepis microstoma]
MLCLYNEGPGEDVNTKPYQDGEPCEKCDKTKYPTCPDKLCSANPAIETTTSSTTCVSSSGVLVMMVHVFVIAVLIAWSCSGELIADERSEIITSHNGIRSNVQPGAQDMLEMIYDTDLETKAQALLVDSCTSTDKIAESQHVNYATKHGDANWTKLIEEWGKEGGKYTYEGGTRALTTENKIVMLSLYDEGPTEPIRVPYEKGEPCQ